MSISIGMQMSGAGRSRLLLPLVQLGQAAPADSENTSGTCRSCPLHRAAHMRRSAGPQVMPPRSLLEPRLLCLPAVPQKAELTAALDACLCTEEEQVGSAAGCRLLTGACA